MLRILLFSLVLMMPVLAFAIESANQILDLTDHSIGIISIMIFIFAHALVMIEERTNLRKSKPVILAAGAIWAMIGCLQDNGCWSR